MYIEIKEVRTIYEAMMAVEEDKSKKVQCRCAVRAYVMHHHLSRRPQGKHRKRLQNSRLTLADMSLESDAQLGLSLPRSVGNCYNACESLKIAVRLAFEYRLEDPALEELFRSLYDCNGSFVELFYNMCDDQNEDNVNLEYFIQQSTRMKLLFPVENEMKPMLECPLNRMYSTCRPIEDAIDRERFNDLELMIRYGARLNYETAFGDKISAAQMALDLVFQCYSPRSDLIIDKPKLPSYLGFLRLVLRAVPHVTYPIQQRYRNESMFAITQTETNNKRAMFEKLQRDGIISAGAAGKEPPLLKHLARLVVRDQLYNAWTLPKGIRDLGLPVALEGYLDLQYD